MSDVVQEKQVASAPRSVLMIRDEEWLVQGVERSAEGAWSFHVQALDEQVRNNVPFSTALDDIGVLEPAAARVVPDDSPGYGRLPNLLEAS